MASKNDVRLYKTKYHCEPCGQEYICENKLPMQAQPCPKCNKVIPAKSNVSITPVFAIGYSQIKISTKKII